VETVAWNERWRWRFLWTKTAHHFGCFGEVSRFRKFGTTHIRGVRTYKRNK